MEDPEQKRFSMGVPSVDRIIMLELEDKELLEACSANKYMRDTVCNESFWETRTKQKKPNAIKPDGMSWKKFYFSKLQITNIPVVDREIMLRIEDRELLQACIANKYMRDTVCNESFWETRSQQEIPNAIKPAGMSWKNFYLSQLQ